jgi:hypothetical protein
MQFTYDAVVTMNKHYQDEIRLLKGENRDLKSRIANESASGGDLSGFSSKVDKLVDKIDGLLKEQFYDLNEIRTVVDENWSLREKNKQLEAAEFSKIISNLRSEIQNLSSQVSNMESLVSAANLKEGKERDLKSSTAWTITSLDLADSKMRIFSCTHIALNKLPDSNHATSLKTMGDIATELFNAYHGDEGFLKDYECARQYAIDHHRAHERIGQGRGKSSSVLKKICMSLRIA